MRRSGSEGLEASHFPESRIRCVLLEGRRVEVLTGVISVSKAVCREGNASYLAVRKERANLAMPP